MKLVEAVNLQIERFMFGIVRSLSGVRKNILYRTGKQAWNRSEWFIRLSAPAVLSMRFSLAANPSLDEFFRRVLDVIYPSCRS